MCHRINAGQVAAVIALAALAAGTMSCAGDGVDCEIDSEFTDTEQSEIRRAADDWNAIAIREVRFVQEGDWLILPASTSIGLGLAQGKRRLIRINPSTPEDQVYAVALHELGHALGLRHVKQGVMDPHRQTIVFSNEDMAECRRAGACN
jgi:hypothetical protein